jgi:hypothetical protein
MELDSAERVFGSYIEIIGGPRGMLNEGFRYQYSLPNINAAIKPGKGGVYHVGRRWKIHTKRFLRKPEGYKTLRRHRNVMLKSI